MSKILSLIILLISLSANALVPLKGLLYGDVQDISQVDPLGNIHSSSAVDDEKLLTDNSVSSFKEYLGLYRQGSSLINSCDFTSQYKYSSKWNEKQARRAIISTLQYIGIDITMKAIVEYLKLLEYEDTEAKNLISNLINNTCSKNITVYSHKLLKNNFLNLYNKSEKVFRLPSLQGSPFVSDEIKKVTNSRDTKIKELDLTIKNFRSFCSWSGDVDNYKLLVPFLNNPYVMSYLFNHLLERKIVYNKEYTSILYEKNSNSVQVICRDLICRKTNSATFKQKFPRVIGSTKLTDDFNSLYCGHFKNMTYKMRDQNPTILKWIKDTTIESPYLESMNFLSLITNKSDLLIASSTYKDLRDLMRSNVKSRWDKWAKEKADNFVTDILFEESLNIDLVSQVKTSNTLKGEFKIVFDYTLGEIDRVLFDVDKVTSVFNLNIPKNYLRWVRKESIKRSNLSDYEGLKELDKKVEEYISLQLKKKEDYFLIPLWTPKMSSIIAKELMSQILEYKGNKLQEFTNKTIAIPVQFRFGLFALKYLNNRFKSNYRTTEFFQAKK